MSNTAAGPLAGFIYQVDLGLLRLLRMDPGEFLTLERTGDLAMLAASGKVSIEIESKHSLNRKKKLSSYSPDLWKTLAIWLKKGLSNKPILPDFSIITNRQVDKELRVLSVPRNQRSQGNPGEIDRLEETLTHVAANQGNQKLLEYSRLWLETEQSSRLRLLTCIYIEAGGSGLGKLQELVRRAIQGKGVHKDRVEQYRQDLDTWYRDLVRQRLAPTGMQISVDELLVRLEYLHRTTSYLDLHFQHANADIPAMIRQQERNKKYQRQLKLVEMPNQVLTQAYEFYTKARLERHSLLNRTLVAQEEIDAHEADIVNAWAVTQSEILTQEGRNPLEQGRELFFECARSFSRLRNSPAPPHLHVGTLHIVADGPDTPRIGWHPHFRQLLTDASSNDER